MEKICKCCGFVFSKNKKESRTQWEQKKFCSQKCAGVNNGALLRGRPLPESTKEKMRGKIPHNKGAFTSSSYGSVHTWLVRTFTKSECEHCSSTRFVEFALKRGCVHAHIRSNYLCLCSSCHKKYDYTPERRKRLSESLKGRVIHWKDKISQANRGRILTLEHRARISENMIHLNKYRLRNKNGQFIKTKI